MLFRSPGAWFESRFGVGPEALRTVLSAALSRGGEDCDLYFEHAASTSVSLSDHKVNAASTQVDLGMGVRVGVTSSPPQPASSAARMSSAASQVPLNRRGDRARRLISTVGYRVRSLSNATMSVSLS